MKLAMIATTVSLFLVLAGASAAPFGSVPLQEPTTEVSTSGSGAPTAPPQVNIGTEPAPMDPQASPSVWDSPSTSPTGPGVSQPMSAPSDKKWVQDSRGARYQVSAGATLPPGWVEIPAPALSPQTQVQTLPALAPNPSFAQPQTYSGAQPQVNLPRQQVQPQSNLYYAPSPNVTPYQMSVGSPGTGLPPGKKRLRHVSGYTVIVSESTTPGPEFTEIESNPMAPPPQASQGPVPGYAAPQQAPMQPPQMYSGYPQQVPQQSQQQQPAYYQQPQTYNSAPELPHVPPTWQQQLPYQPPQPQYQAPVPGQAPYPQQMQQQAPLPVVRKTPTGKKWVADQSGLRYLVDESTVVMPPMREVTEAELTQPMYIGPQPGQQQQQPQGSAIGRFFQGLTNR